MGASLLANGHFPSVDTQVLIFLSSAKSVVLCLLTTFTKHPLVLFSVVFFPVSLVPINLYPFYSFVVILVALPKGTMISAYIPYARLNEKLVDIFK